MEQRHQLTPEHEAYLLERHGTTDLDPLPPADPNDPYNWPSWKKNANLAVVAFQGLTTVLNAAGVIPALPLLMEDLRVSVHKVTYIIGVNILFLGIAPLFWKPFANRFGRRPTWLLATLGSGLLNIGCVYSRSYGTMIAFRILTACFLSPVLGLGGAVVTETFFSNQRATKLGIWTVAFTIGPSLGPFLAGFIVYHTNNWQWVYWFFVIVSLATFVAALFLCPETLYIRNSPSAQQQLTIKKQDLSFRRIDPTQFTLAEICQPYVMLLRPSVLLPTASYAMVFCFASPAIGLQFLAIMIDATIGEQVGGFLSDGMMRWKRGAAERRPAEFRLSASYIGFATAIAGMVEWGVTLQNAPVGRWTVKPDIGLGILTFGLQVVTTILITYAVDCNHNEAAAVGAAINQARQIWSFIGPFWFVPMYDALGVAKAGGMMAGLIAAAAVPILALHILASSMRRSSGHFVHPGFKPEHQSMATKDTGASSYVEKDAEA